MVHGSNFFYNVSESDGRKEISSECYKTYFFHREIYQGFLLYTSTSGRVFQISKKQQQHDKLIKLITRTLFICIVLMYDILYIDIFNIYY